MHLNNDFFKDLHSKMAGFKKQVADLKMKQMEKNGVKESPCPICGEIYNSWNGFAQRKTHCPACEKNLADGYTALVSVDGRYAFVKWPDATEEQRAAVAGKTMTIDNARMDAIEADSKPSKPGENPANN